MSETDWAFPSELRPRPEDWSFDLEHALGALVLLRAEVPEDAFTAQILGTERLGNGVVIRDDGLILTIGYLITEATAVWITTAQGAVLAGHPLAYDQATGFGLVLPLGRLGLPALARGSAALARVGDDVVVAGHGGRAHALKGQIFDKREFAGYWEYVLDEALFASPAHPQWGGSALIGSDGRLLGIGSLLVEEKQGDKSVQGNMFVPVDLLEPILEDLVKRGRTRRAARPWLGMYTTEMGAKLVVAGLSSGGPADRAGI
jgi:S1-C subfamily serine protease